jgi:hypothetical protein
MHKRRIDALSPILKELNAAVYGDFCKQIYDEVARTYAEMVDLKV